MSGTLLDEVKNRAADLMANENMPWETAVAQAREELEDPEPAESTGRSGLSVVLRSYNDVDDDVPTWVWEHGGNGRIPLGELTLFAGRPAAGKSTAARWFASQITRGTLPGEWQGHPHGVAYIAGEESLKYSVKPSLRAAGADMGRVYYPETVTRTEDIEDVKVNYVPTAGMPMLARALRAADVKLVVVDPLMSMMGSGTDIYRNNEVRERVQPWVDLAHEIDGVVIGIAHLNKSSTGDVLAGINGSSAFGELCRAAFGFAKDTESDEGHRVMSQEKNSLGSEDLALTYTLAPKEVTTASGKTAEMTCFTILGESDRRVGDVLRAAAAPVDRDGEDGDEVKMIVLDYLESHGGSAPAGEVLKATRAAGLSDKTVKNRRKAIGVSTHRDGPNRWVWTIDRGLGDPESVPVHQDLGTSGPSSSEGTFEVPKQSRSRGPVYTREGRDLATVTALPATADVADEMILDALDTEFGLSPETVAGSVPGLTRENAPARLAALADTGRVIADSRGRYTKIGATA